MPIVFEVNYTDHTKDTARVWISQKSDTVVVPNKNGMQIAYTLFDPGYQVLKTVNATKSYNEWLMQAKEAQNMIDRYDAVQALRDTATDKKRDDLIRLFDNKDYYPIKAEIIIQLKKDIDNRMTIALMKKALKDENFNVRRAVIDNIDTIPESLLADCEPLLRDSSYLTIENTLKKLVRQYPQNKQRYFDAVRNTIGISKNVRIIMLELEAPDKPADKEELIDYTSHSYEFRTRVKAMESLERLSYANEALIKNLVDAILNPNTRLANPAIRAIKKLMDKQDVKDMAIVYYKNGTWQGWQKDILKGVFEPAAK